MVEEQLDATFLALADPTRREILDASFPYDCMMDKAEYEAHLNRLQLQLVRMLHDVIASGKRIAVLARWDETARWLAAPRMEKRITNGVLMFTPDASRAEAERLAQALNKTVKLLSTGRP